MNRVSLAAGLLLACAGLGPARAGGVVVNPIRLELPPGQAATSLKVSLDGDEGKVFQVSVLHWIRQDGEDRYAEAAEDEAPIVTPPLFKLAGGRSQVVRIGFRQPPSTPVESAWRVILDEVPPPPAAAAEATASGLNIRMRLRISLPLFLLPSGPHHQLLWQGAVDTNGQVRLTAINSGNVSERIDDLALAADAAELGRLHGPIYVFPGEQRQLQLAAGAAAKPGPVRLELHGTQPPPGELVLRAQ